MPCAFCSDTLAFVQDQDWISEARRKSEISDLKKLLYMAKSTFGNKVNDLCESRNEFHPQGELNNQTANTLPPDITDVPPVDNSRNTIEQPVAPEKPWITVELMPEFPGGNDEMFRFLAQNLRYPVEAREISVSGKVYIYFVVEPDGSISSLKVMRGIGSGCDEEALRVVGLMPKWTPGKQGGVAVRVQYILPVRFTLQ